MKRGLGAILVAIAVAALLALATPSAVMRAQSIDVSGTWRIAFPSPLIGDCILAIHQEGAALSAIAECNGTVTRLRLTGTVDQTVGRLGLDDPDYIRLEGVVSPDSNTITGTYDLAERPIRAFTATRNDSIDLIDLSGDWRLTLEGDTTKECTLHIDQSFSEALVQYVCPDMSDAETTGEISPLSGSFGLADSNRHVENYMNGRSSSDGKYLVGELGFDVNSWKFVAVRQGQDVSGLVRLSCPCSVDVGETFTIDVRVVDLPAGGYDGFHVGLAWNSEQVSVRSIGIRDCGSSSILVAQDHASFDCSYGNTRQAGGVIAQVTVTCTRLGGAKLDIAGTSLNGPDGQPITPSIIGAEIFCWTSTGSGPGDGSCDGAVSSVDAALVLQYEAGLLPLSGCLALADINFDDAINSIDAALILQCSAGFAQAC